MPIDWTKSMNQTYEFYIVDPATWGDKTLFTKATDCTISRDLFADTRGSATINTTEELEECYIRVYLIATQNGEMERVPLGTYLVQTPSVSYDGRISKTSMDAYTPLLELRDRRPPYGFAVMKGVNTMDTVSSLTRENVRAPVVPASDPQTVPDNFVANFQSDNWLTYLSDLAASAKFEYGLDELGRILFNPIQKISSLQPVWTYDDGNSSILRPNLTLERDLYGVPNVVEVLYSNDKGFKFSRVENNDVNSPISRPRRGRDVVYRVSNPASLLDPTQEQLDVYATTLLESKSVLEYSLTYTHGYCPVRIGDCVLLNYKRAGLTNTKAMVSNQSIECRPGTQVTETAFFTTKLWG